MYRFSWATAAAVALALVAAAPAAATTRTLSVIGNGKVFVTPNVADVSVSVTRRASSSSQALSAANHASDAIVHAVEALGIPAKDIQTQNVYVSSFKRKHQHHKRWSANESLGIHITNVKLVGPVIDAATHAGASGVSGPAFSFSNPSAGVKAATRAAIADAQARASAAAAAIDYRVTGVKSINLDPGGGVIAPSAPGAVHGGSGTPTSIHPGSEEVDAQVAIVFTIAPA